MGLLDAPGLSRAAVGDTNTIGILGDSLADNQDAITGTPGVTGYVTYFSPLYGFVYVALAMLSGRLRMVLNTGVQGTRTDQWISAGQVTAMIAARPAWCVITPPTNDKRQDIPLATAQANYLAVVKALRAAGIKVILVGLGPEASGSVGATMTQSRLEFLTAWNHWIKTLAASTPGIYTVDPFRALNDGGLTGNWVDTTTLRWTPDNLHPINWSSFRIGKLLADLLEPLVPYLDIRPAASFDNGSAAITSRNLISSAGFSGTAGGNGSTKGGTGTVKTGYSVTSSDGANFGGTVTSSMVAATDQCPIAWQQHSLTTAFSNLRVQQTGITTGYTAGTTVVRPQVEIDIDPGAQIRNLVVAMQAVVPGGAVETQWAYRYPGTAGTADWPDENRLTKDYRGRYPVLVGPDMLIPSNATSIGWYIDYSGMGTFRWRYPALRANPGF